MRARYLLNCTVAVMVLGFLPGDGHAPPKIQLAPEPAPAFTIPVYEFSISAKYYNCLSDHDKKTLDPYFCKSAESFNQRMPNAKDQLTAFLMDGDVVRVRLSETSAQGWSDKLNSPLAPMVLSKNAHAVLRVMQNKYLQLKRENPQQVFASVEKLQQ